MKEHLRLKIRTRILLRAVLPASLDWMGWEIRKLLEFLKGNLWSSHGSAQKMGKGNFRVQWLWWTALRAAREISELDPEAKTFLAETPKGLAEFQAGTFRAWIQWDGTLEVGKGKAPKAPDVILEFRDETTAAAALKPDFESAVALGRGDLTVHGLLPLAEGLGLVMERINVYVGPSHKSFSPARG